MQHERVWQRQQRLTRLVVLPLAELGPFEARTAQYNGPGDYAYEGDWASVSLPCQWQPLKTVFLRAQYAPVQAPADYDVFLEFRQTDFEGMVSVDGVPYAGMDAKHPRAPAPPKAGELTIEAIASPVAMCRPEQAAAARFDGVAVVGIHREAEQARLTLQYALWTWEALEASRRKSLLGEALEAAMLQVDVSQPHEEVCRQLVAAGAVLRERLAEIGRDDEGGRVFLAGHTHIDVAWLWPIRETIRKCSRTFSTVCRLMERYPDFHFSCSQAQLYAYTQRHYPALFEEIRHWVAEGRWHTTGAMWVEPDCHATSGESLVRQILFGLRFYREAFGTRPRACWLPDVFGFPASMPQILQRSGLPYFYTFKLHWHPQNPFPLHLFNWEGIDGSRVLASVTKLKGAYIGTPDPQELRYAWDEFLDKDRYPEVLFPYGHGDGGGGPTADMIEYMRRADDFPGLPRCRTGHEETYFTDVEQSGRVTDVWTGELYLETHRGTFTTHADAKAGNRRCEAALRDAEILAAGAAWAGQGVDMAPLREAWELTLVNQFHDILPGSSIGPVYEDMRQDYETVMTAVAGVRAEALQALTRPAGDSDVVTLVNTFGWTRSDPVRLPAPAGTGAVGVQGEDGTILPAQRVDGETGQDLLFEPDGVPGFACRRYRVLTDAPAVLDGVRVEETMMESPFYRLAFDRDGSMVSLTDKRVGRELVPPGERLNELQFFQDGPVYSDAWNIQPTTEDCRLPCDQQAVFEVVEAGPVRGVVRITRRFRASTFVQDVILYRGTPRIDVVTQADWQERHVRVKAAFPLAVRAPSATAEIQFGAFERSTLGNKPWDTARFEVPAQRWVDLSESGYGVSLLNDSKVGHDIDKSRIRLTLLRGAGWPDPEADRGEHRFTYSLLPHAGGWADARTVQRAAELNAPLQVVTAREPLTTEPWLQLDGMAAVAEALKPAEDGRGWILRLYEPHGARGQVTIKTAPAVSEVIETNLVEEDEGSLSVEAGAFSVGLTPFQIRTFRLLQEGAR